VKTIRHRLRSLWQRRAVKREIDEELRCHLEQRTAENIAAGMSPEEAAREARKRFGNLQSIREECREAKGASFGEATWQDVRFGLRMLRKNPGFTGIAVAILALGIGANTAIFSVVHTFMLRPLPYDHAGELVVLHETASNRDNAMSVAAGPKYLEWRKLNTSFQEMGALSVFTETLAGNVEPTPVVTCHVTPSCLRVWRFRLAFGRTFAEDEDEAGKNQLVILSHPLWKNRFGGRTNVIGQTVRLDGKPHTIVGILAAGGLANWENSEIALVPLAAEVVRDGPGVHYYQVFGRLKPGVTLAQARGEMTVLAERLRQQHREFGDWGIALRSLREDELDEWPGWQTVFLLQGAVMLVLLIACANMANLLLARAAARQKEIAIRLAVGGNRGRVIRQLLVESVLLACLGGVAGVVFAAVGIEAAQHWFATQDITLWTDLRLEPVVLAFSVGLAGLTGIVFGLVPAWQASRVDLQTTLKSASQLTSSGVAHRRMLDFFAVSEIGLALALLIGAGLFVRNLTRLNRIDPGFNPARVLALGVSLTEAAYPSDAQRDQFVASALERLRTRPGVRGAAMADVLPLGGGSSWDFWVEGRERNSSNAWASLELRRVSHGYFGTLGVMLLRGRTFSTADRHGSESVAIINETLARQFFPGEDPVGARVGTGDGIANPHRVIGVVRDERVFGLTGKPAPVVYVPMAQGWFKGSRANYSMEIAVRTEGDPLALAKPVQAELRALDPDLAFARVGSLDRRLSVSLLSQRLSSFMLGSFSLTALALAALGIYGVMSNGVNQRAHELGIRMALGARPGDILRLVLGRGLRLTAGGTALGLAGALGLTRFLNSFLSDMSPTDPWTFAAVTGFLTAVSFLPCCVPARRAAKVDPMQALRCE